MDSIFRGEVNYFYLNWAYDTNTIDGFLGYLLTMSFFRLYNRNKRGLWSTDSFFTA